MRGAGCLINISDVQADAITLFAGDSKNREGRTIPLEGELAELIERRRKQKKVLRIERTAL